MDIVSVTFHWMSVIAVVVDIVIIAFHWVLQSICFKSPNFLDPVISCGAISNFVII